MSRAKVITGAPAFWRLGDSAPPGGAHAALVPGALAPMLPLELPDRLRGMARERVAGRQLVEQLAMPAAGFEMRPYTAKGKKQWSRALITDPEQEAAWRKALRPGCVSVLPDYLALPAAEGLWTIELSGGMVRARLAPGDGFTAEPELALEMLAVAAPPGAVLRLGDASEQLDGFLAGLEVKLLSDPAALRKAGFSVLRWADATGGINLKDPPSALYDRLRGKLLRWRVAVVCSVLALALWMGLVALETRRLQADAVRDGDRAEALVRTHFVPAGPILDVRAQVTAALEAASGPAEPLAEALPALTRLQIAAPLLTADTLRLPVASYRADTGLVATVEAQDFAALDRLVEDLQAADFIVEQLDSRAQQEGGVVARLRLELAQ